MKRSSFLFKTSGKEEGGLKALIWFSHNVFMVFGSLHVGWHDFSSLRSVSNDFTFNGLCI